MVDIWGRADNGSIVHITVDGADDVEIGEWWPFDGLERVDAPLDGAEPAAVFAVDARNDGCWDRLESDLGLFAAEWLDGLIAVHAAVLVSGDVMILIPGTSMTGKTSMCVAALDAGIEVWSDEYALIDPETGMTSGWPRRLSVREGHGIRRRVANDGGLRGRSSLMPALVAHVFYSAGEPESDGDTEFTLTALTAGEITSALLANTVCAQSRPRESFDAATNIARHARGVGGRRGEADDTIQRLLKIAHTPQ